MVSTLFRCTGAKEYAAKKLTTREEDRLDEALSKLKASERRKDVLVCVFLLVLYGAQSSEPPSPLSTSTVGEKEKSDLICRVGTVGETNSVQQYWFSFTYPPPLSVL